MAAPKTLLLCCGSLGLGNSARLLGVVQALRRRGIARERLRVAVAAAGPGARFWAGRAADVAVQLIPLEELRFAERPHESPEIRWSGFLRLQNAAAYARNDRALRAWLRSCPADLALVDSDYHCLPLLRSSTPILALGQAWDVLRRLREREGESLPARSLLVERLDFLFQRAVAGEILVPCFDPGGPAPAKVRRIPLIVRAEFASPPARPSPAASPLLVMTGGSGTGAAPLLEYARRFSLPTIGAAGEPSPTLDAAGRPLIDAAAAVVIQGGLSSISECAARRRRMIVVPIESHAEQIANALEVQRRGLGLRVRDLDAPPAAMLERLERELPPARDALWPRADGAEAAAEILLARLGLSR